MEISSLKEKVNEVFENHEAGLLTDDELALTVITVMMQAVPQEEREFKQTNYKAIELMERIGGGFASALAITWRRADLENQRRLMASFQDLHDQYESLLPKVKD